MHLCHLSNVTESVKNNRGTSTHTPSTMSHDDLKQPHSNINVGHIILQSQNLINYTEFGVSKSCLILSPVSSTFIPDRCSVIESFPNLFVPQHFSRIQDTQLSASSATDFSVTGPKSTWPKGQATHTFRLNDFYFIFPTLPKPSPHTNHCICTCYINSASSSMLIRTF